MVSEFTPLEFDEFTKLIGRPLELLNAGDKEGADKANQAIKEYRDALDAHIAGILGK